MTDDTDDARLPAPRGSSLSLEVFGSIVDEGVKAVAVQAGIDEFTAAGIGAGAGALMKSLPDALREAWRRRASRAAEADEEAFRTSGQRYEALLLEALKDDRKLWLLRNAFATAQSEEDRRRVRFYGRIAADGVLAEDRARVDAAARVFSTIAALDPSDLKALLHLTEATRPEGEDWKIGQAGPGQHSLTEELPELEEVVESVVARLDTLGLINTRTQEGGNFGRPDFRTTNYAFLCRRELMRGEEAGSP